MIVLECPPLTQLTVEDDRPDLLVGDRAQGISAGLHGLAAEAAVLGECDRGGLIGAYTIHLAIRFHFPEDIPSFLVRAAIDDRDILCAQRIMRAIRVTGLSAYHASDE